MQKVFKFTAKGMAFNLETFETENRVFFTQTNTIIFQSKDEFIQCIDKAIDDFYLNYNKSLESDVPQLEVDYRGEKLKLIHFTMDGNSFTMNTNRCRIRDAIFELVRQTERKLAAHLTRGALKWEGN